MQFLFWILFLDFSKEESTIKKFDDMISEMKSNPIAFNISILFVSLLRSKTLCKTPESVLKTLLCDKAKRNIIEKHIFLLQKDMKYFTPSEIELLCFTAYFKPDSKFSWFLLFQTRIIYIVFCEFKDIMESYFTHLNDKCEFIEYINSYVSKYYFEEIQDDEDFFENIQENEKKIILNDFKEISMAYSKGVASNETMRSTEESTSNRNPDLSGGIQKYFGSLNSKLNKNKISENKVRKDIRQHTIFSKKPIYIDHEHVRKDMIAKAKNCHVTYGFHSDLTILFELIFEKYFHSSFDKEFYREHFNPEILKIYKVLSENPDEKIREIAFENFYKIIFTYFEKHIKNLLSHVRSESFFKYKDINAFFLDLSCHIRLENPTPCGLSFKSLNSNPNEIFCNSEYVFVFDIDDTLFPTDKISSAFEEIPGLLYTTPDRPLKDFLIKQEKLQTSKTEEEWEKIVEKFLQMNEFSKLSTILSHLKFKNKLKETLQRIQHRKICFTNAKNDWAYYVLKELDLLDCFDVVIHREYESLVTSVLKPDEKAYEFVEKFLRISTSNIYFFDDKSENIEAATKRGWKAFQVTESLVDVIKESLKSLEKSMKKNRRKNFFKRFLCTTRL
ncbi:putative pyrimidine 5'-nucleotidase [Hamiltosporidium tvaerminnensis]|uniref:Putative pyrimidine 5'-nucleotidase n=1 Tax=Hamiltosporidium tvaerminnensis TaxID=1176355 RepID=A0A4Q9LV03_9MICR|nr:putative pyrimidine 5'-nucleotidase [Hamiltosporidium tvaerminnensis]